MNTHCLMRQEVQLLSAKFINDLYIYIMSKYQTNKASNFTQDIETYTSDSHVIPHNICANVLVLEQIKHMNSQMPKISNQTLKKKKKSIIRSCVQNFKLTNEYQITILRSTKIFKTNMNMHFFSFQKKKKKKKWDKVCVNVSHTPKLKLHIVPNVCIT
jgi:hypothetical protein